MWRYCITELLYYDLGVAFLVLVAYHLFDMNETRPGNPAESAFLTVNVIPDCLSCSLH